MAISIMQPEKYDRSFLLRCLGRFLKNILILSEISLRVGYP